MCRVRVIIRASLIFLVTACGPRTGSISVEAFQKELLTPPKSNQIEDMDLVAFKDEAYWIDTRFASDHGIFVVSAKDLEIEGYADGKTPLPMELTVRMLYLREGRKPGATREPLNPYLFR